MVYFWQKQIRNFRNSNNNNVNNSSNNNNNNNNNSESIASNGSSLISAAVTAADTAFAAVIVSKHGSSSFHPSSSLSSLPSPSPSSASTSSSSSSSSKASSPLPSAINDNGPEVQHNGVLTISGSVAHHQGNGSSNNGGRSSAPSSSGPRDSNNNTTTTTTTTTTAATNASASKIQSRVLDKLSEYSRRKQETNKRRVAERELDSLNMKIDKLLSKMDDVEIWSPEKFKREEECVVCMAAPASMKTFPCGHRVVCRKCLIKTMQVAISQRCLPLRCVICRDRILSLQHAQEFSSATSSKSNNTPHCFDADVINNSSSYHQFHSARYYGNNHHHHHHHHPHHHVNSNHNNNNYIQYRWGSESMNNNNNDIDIPNNNQYCFSGGHNLLYHHSIKRGKDSIRLSRSSAVPIINSPTSESSMSTSTSSSSSASSASSSSSSSPSSSNVLSDEALRHPFHNRQDQFNVQSIDHWLQCK